MDLVDEQHVALFEIGQQRREIAGLGDHRTGGRPEIDAELLGHDLRQRRLAKPGRADEQHVIQRLAAHLCRFDEDLQVGAGFRLAGELVERLRPERGIGILAALVGGNEAGGLGHQGSSNAGCGSTGRQCRTERRGRRSAAQQVANLKGNVARHNQRDSSFRPSRISVALLAPSPPAFMAAATALAAWSRE